MKETPRIKCGIRLTNLSNGFGLIEFREILEMAEMGVGR